MKYNGTVFRLQLGYNTFQPPITEGCTQQLLLLQRELTHWSFLTVL